MRVGFGGPRGSVLSEDVKDVSLSASKPDMMTVIKAHFRAEPKKTAMLGVLALVMVVVYVYMFVGRAPSDAEAEPVEASVSPAVIGEAATSLLQERPRSTPRWTHRVVSPAAIRRNPFQCDWTCYRDDPEALLEEEPDLPPEVDGPDPRNQRLIRLYDSLSEMTLHSTVCGTMPLAVIDEEVVRVGGRVDEFTVEAIHARSVVLRNGEDLFELRMD